jgi:integrase
MARRSKPRLVRPWVTRYVDADGRRVPKDHPGARKVREQTANYYAQGLPGLPRAKRVPLAATTEREAEKELARLEDEAERGVRGWASRRQAERPLTEHLDDFEAHLRAGGPTGRGSTEKQVRQKVGRVRRLVAACRWATIADVNASYVEQFLARVKGRGKPLAPPDPAQDWYTKAELAALLGVSGANVAQFVARHRLAAEGQGKAWRFPKATAEALYARAARGKGVQTANYYLREVKAFTRFLVDANRLGVDPLRRLKGGNAQLDRRHDRRNLDPAELARLFEAARSSPDPYRGLAGPDRLLLYATACGTGFREGELAALRPEWFKLDHHPPLIELPARLTKNRRPVRQPIPGGLAGSLAAYLAGKPAGKPVWPGTWAERGAEMLRRDLEAAGIPYAVEGPDGPLYADFHALRHSYITLLQQMRATAKQAQTLARHSDVNLTLRRYTHASLAELGEAVGVLRFLVTPDTTPALPASDCRGTVLVPRTSGPSDFGLGGLSRADLEAAAEGLLALATAQAALLSAVLVAPVVAQVLRTDTDSGGLVRTNERPERAAS